MTKASLHEMNQLLYNTSMLTKIFNKLRNDRSIRNVANAGAFNIGLFSYLASCYGKNKEDTCPKTQEVKENFCAPDKTANTQIKHPNPFVW